jgi:hypothetical protein
LGWWLRVSFWQMAAPVSEIMATVLYDSCYSAFSTVIQINFRLVWIRKAIILCHENIRSIMAIGINVLNVYGI